MTGKISILTASLICASLSTGTYFLGKSNSPESKSNLVETETRRSSYGVSGSRDRNESAVNRSAAGRALREFREQGAAATVESIFSINDPLKRGDAFRRLLDEMPAEDFTAFIDAFRNSGLAQQNMGDYEMALYSWAQKDPTTALAYAEENTSSLWTRQTLVSAWAQYDAIAAEDWALSHFDGEGANPWLVGVIDGVVSTDLDTATRLINMLPFSEERGNALGEMIPVVSRLGFDEAVSWLDGIEDKRLKDGATRRLAGEFGSSDPEAAIAWAEAIDDEDLRLSTVSEVVDGWIRKDLDSGVAYVQNLPQETQLSMARNFVRDLGRQDFDVASNWLESLGSDPRVDEARMRLGWTGLRGGNQDKAMLLLQDLAASDSPQARRAQQTINRMERRRRGQ